jgi:hypothetical protein
MMVTDLGWLKTPTRLAYTAFDVSITVLAFVLAVLLLLRMLEDPRPTQTDGRFRS